MNNILHNIIYQFAASGNDSAIPPGNEPHFGALPENVMVALKPCNSTKEFFAKQGYTNTRVFFTLPTLNSPRWLFPLGNASCTFKGLQIYKPYATAARVLKGLLTTMVAAHCQNFVPHRLLVASQRAIPLENLVREVTGECQPIFSMYVGTESRFQKLTIQAMRPDGEILGYIKLPLTDAAVERVRHEAEILNRLWSFPALRSHIPKVLYSGEWGPGSILFQSGGPSRPGPILFNHQYEEFLRLLPRIHTTQKPGYSLCEEVAARWRIAEPSLDSGWRTLGWAAIEKARRKLDGIRVPYGVAHGDFTPWNTRVGDVGLYVFDWERASWEAPISWDIFHFKTQVAVLLKKRIDLHISLDRESGERASFLLYLLNSVCQLFSEGSLVRGPLLEYRRQLLANHLEGY